jgi:hypothetical protein
MHRHLLIANVRRPPFIMAKSGLAKEMDEIQARLRSLLKDNGYRVRGRTFNRSATDGLVQVVSFQMGSFDPPGTTYIPGLRENLYGRFTVNLGVYVPEVAIYLGSGEKTFVQEYHCCVRARLGPLGPEERDFWWLVRAADEVVLDVRERLLRDAFPFLERFGNRDAILFEWKDRSKNLFEGSPPRIVCAIILAARGQTAEARKLLAAQAQETLNPGHPKYVRGLATKLGLGNLDGE